jgi:hypothetical protein
MKGFHAGADGATLVEAAIAVPLFLLFVFGIVEFGLGFKDWLSLNNAAGEAGRVAAAVADGIDADKLALEALEEGLVGDMMPGIEYVEIADANDPTRVNQYVPATTVCGWAPCPDIAINPTFETDVPWPPTARQVVAPRAPGDPDLDTIRVSIRFVHDWLTGFVGDASTWTADKTIRIEPQL